MLTDTIIIYTKKQKLLHYNDDREIQYGLTIRKMIYVWHLKALSEKLKIGLKKLITALRNNVKNGR